VRDGALVFRRDRRVRLVSEATGRRRGPRLRSRTRLTRRHEVTAHVEQQIGVNPQPRTARAPPSRQESVHELRRWNPKRSSDMLVESLGFPSPNLCLRVSAAW